MIKQILQGPSSGRWPAGAQLKLDTPKSVLLTTVLSGESPWSQLPPFLPSSKTPSVTSQAAFVFHLLLFSPPQGMPQTPSGLALMLSKYPYV